jgi:hypothetical protein
MVGGFNYPIFDLKTSFSWEGAEKRAISSHLTL